MKLVIGNAKVKRVALNKEKTKSYVTVGDIDEVKEVDFSAASVNIKEGYVGGIILSGVDIVFRGGFISCETVDPIAAPKKS